MWFTENVENVNDQFIYKIYYAAVSSLKIELVYIKPSKII